MGTPKSWVDTGNYIHGLRIFTDELIPNCLRCFLIEGTHKKTKERGYYAFCTKSGKIESVGPYKNYHEALRFLTLTKSCDSCTFNKSEAKEAYLPLLDEKFKKEMETLYGIGQDLSVAMSPVQHFVESRNYLDVNFKTRFGVRLFNAVTDDSVAVIDLVKPCSDQKDFALKVQALAGMIDRINEKELKDRIKNKEKEKLQGSINILEQFLNENFSHYPSYIISNLRNMMALRNKMYPAHTTAAEIVVILRNFGIDKYPLDDWERGLRKIVGLCANSLADLVKLVQS
jgi:hypothetical protein